jgi:hypothetical protein
MHYVDARYKRGFWKTGREAIQRWFLAHKTEHDTWLEMCREFWRLFDESETVE